MPSGFPIGSYRAVEGQPLARTSRRNKTAFLAFFSANTVRSFPHVFQFARPACHRITYAMGYGSVPDTTCT